MDEKNQLKRFLRPTSTSSSSTAKKPKIVSFIEKIGMNKQVAPLLELVSIIQILEMLTKFGSDSESDSSCSAGHLSDKEDLILSRLNEPTTSSSKLCSLV